jgi:hypothetical protein
MLKLLHGLLRGSFLRFHFHRTRKKSKKLAEPSRHMTREEELALEEEERLRKQEKRRAKRLAKHFAELGLDENGRSS